jgi:hypothetical protein
MDTMDTPAGVAFRACEEDTWREEVGVILFYHYGRAMVLKHGRVGAAVCVCVGLRSLRMCREERYG